MRIHFKFSFFPPLILLVFLSCVIYIICLINEALHLQNLNYESSLVRDKEEIRMAQIRTLISYWSNERQKLPFQYKSEQLVDHSNHDYVKLANPPGINVAILTPNRASSSSDAYETFYLTNSVVSFMNATYYDLARYGNRFSFINFIICSTDDYPSRNKELKTVKHLLGDTQIKYRPEPWTSKSLSCRTVLDAGNCLLKSLGSMNNTYTLLIEDDLIPDHFFFKHVWDIFVRLDSKQLLKKNPPGLIQLYTPKSLIYFSIFNFSSMVELIIFSSFLTVMLFTVYFRLWWKPLFCFYNVILIVCTFFTSVFIICLLGRLTLLSLVHHTLSLYTVSLSPSPRSVSTGAAALVSSELAYKLGNQLLSIDCDSFERVNSPVPPKATLIYDFLMNQKLSIWSVFPSVVEHVGLYSVFNGGVPNPFRVD